jgi:hypothetical protein
MRPEDQVSNSRWMFQDRPFATIEERSVETAWNAELSADGLERIPRVRPEPADRTKNRSVQAAGFSESVRTWSVTIRDCWRSVCCRSPGA